MRTARAGFTLIELLITIVLTAVILGAIYQTMSTQQRTYRRANEIVAMQQLTRTSLEVLTSELRELSATATAVHGGSDLTAIAPQQLSFRAMRKVGVMCAGTPATGNLWIYDLGEPFVTGDPILIFTDNEPDAGNDDGWQASTVLAAVPGVNVGCPAWTMLDGAAYPVIDLSVTPPANPAGVLTGAPIRSFLNVTYGLYQVGGDWVLGRQIDGGPVAALIGPLSSDVDGGLGFTYLDRNGAQTADAALVERVRIQVRGESRAGTELVDSLSTEVFLRNNDNSTM